MTALFRNATPYLNYQPYNFTVFIVCFLTVPQSSKCIQISKVHLQIIKKYAWLDLLIQNKYRSWFSRNKAIILHFLAIVWVITWAATAVSQGFAGSWEFSGFCGEPGDCRSCCVFYRDIELKCLAAATEKGSPTPLDQGSCYLAWCTCVGVSDPMVSSLGSSARLPSCQTSTNDSARDKVSWPGVRGWGAPQTPFLLGDSTVRLVSHEVKPWC